MTLPTSQIFSRRSFLAASAAAAAAGPFVYPSRATASRLKATGVAPSNRITLGLIGMGIQNRYHLDAFVKNSRSQVLAVCDCDTTRRNDAKGRVDSHYKPSQGDIGCIAYNDYREMLARKDIDAVVISSPDHWHTIMILDAFAAGKDVYCEKPLTLTLHESKVCIEAAAKYGRILQTGSQQRTEYSNRFRTAAQCVRAGRMGKIFAIYAGLGTSSEWCDLPEESMEPGLDWDRWLGPAPLRPYNSILSPRGVNKFYPKWREYREYSGGMMTDWGAHHFDIAQWMLGADDTGPVEIIPPHDSAAMHGTRFRYGNGVELIHGGPAGVTVVAERGTLHVDRDQLVANPESIIKEPFTDPAQILPVINDHRANWLDCVANRTKPVCDVEVGARSAAICHLGNLAYWHRKPLVWNPKTWEFTGANAQEANTWRDYDRREGYRLQAV